MRYLFFASLFLIIYHFLLYPLLLCFLTLFRQKKMRLITEDYFPSVSILVVVHNGEDIISDKIENCLNLTYPEDKLEIVIASDGSDDRTTEKAAQCLKDGVRLFNYPAHEGKIVVLNKAVPLCKGEVIVFSDVDALLAKDAILKLSSWFSDPSVGGVCGRKVVTSEKSTFADSQSRYISYENFIREKENVVASISSNEGKLYAIRRKLFQLIPDAVTDDLYNAMSVIRQKYLFVFEPMAKAFIPVPSSNTIHEVERRRRIVSQSLLGLWHMKKLFNPFEYGFYSFMLFSHKLLRRFMPIFMIILFVSNASIAISSKFFTFLFILHSLFYFQAVAYHLKIISSLSLLPPFGKLISTSYYFCLGNWGTLLGVLDILKGKQITKWHPKKVR